jgi:hypothetical protein
MVDLFHQLLTVWSAIGEKKRANKNHNNRQLVKRKGQTKKSYLGGGDGCSLAVAPLWKFTDYYHAPTE